MFPGTPGFSLVGVAQLLAPPHPVTQFGGFDLILNIKNVTITDSEYQEFAGQKCAPLIKGCRLPHSSAQLGADPRAERGQVGPQALGGLRRGAHCSRGGSAEPPAAGPPWSEVGAWLCSGRGVLLQSHQSLHLQGSGEEEDEQTSSDCFQQAHEPCSLSRSSRSA